MARELRVAVSPLREGELDLSGKAYHYVVGVHRCREGDVLTVFDPHRGVQARATILSVGSQRAVCAVAELELVSRSGLVATSLLHCASKGHRSDDVVRSATALGVARIVFVRSERSVAGLAPKPERWRAVAQDAARQSGRGDLPELLGIASLEEALNDFASAAAHKWFCSPTAKPSLYDEVASWSPCQPAILVIGPEGGFGPNDERLLKEHAVVPVRLAHFVLRTELAATSALAVLAAAAQRDAEAPSAGRTDINP